MANYAVWNVRRRHEWLASPLKKKRFRKRAAGRLGARGGQDVSVAAAPPGEAENKTDAES